jgi:pimeloyl-ACP methyl ester carboxylesterase
MTQFATAPDGVRIAYDDSGSGRPLLLIHGFAASRVITWRNTLWYDWLAKSGIRAIAVDCRGHGESGMPHDPAAYDEGIMAADALAVLDACRLTHADVMGYSMGGYLAIRLAHDIPQRLDRVILGGVGGAYFDFWESRSETIAAGLIASDPAMVTDAMAREFRRFAEAAKNDLAALAACMRRKRIVFSQADLAEIAHPVLVVCGELDDVSGGAEALAQCFPHGHALTIPGRNHHMTVGDKRYKEAVAEFLAP